MNASSQMIESIENAPIATEVCFRCPAALGEPGIFVITTGDVNVLPKLLDAAERFERRPADAEVERMVERLQMEPLFV